MAVAPTHPSPTAPLALPAQPDRTGGRAIGVLLVHGFTGSPASLKPWGQALADQGYAVEVPLLPGHGTRWQDLNAASASVALRLAETRGADVSGVILVNPFVASMRTELHLLPVLKHVVPALRGVANDIKKPDQDEHGYDRLPLKGLAEVTAMWKVVVPDLKLVTQPLLYFRSNDDHVIDVSSSPTILHGVSSADIEERTLENSYHVATLDHDAERIFSESAEFVARVCAA